LARVIDREVAPVWHDRFARMIYRELPLNPRTFVLDVHCGPGRSTAELLQRLDAGSRVLALEGDPAMVTLAKTRVKPEWKKRVYFKGGDFDDITAMAEDTYDLTVANLVLGEVVHDWKAALRELARVTKPGGQVLATLPLAGTWAEVDDLFEEVLRDHGLRRELVTLHKLRRLRPQAGSIGRALEHMGFDPDDYVIEQEKFQILFRSGREFLFAPVVEHGPLRLWKAVLQKTPKPQQLFWEFKEAIDTYYAGHVLSVTAVAGLIRLRVPAPDLPPFATAYWRRYPGLARIWGLSEGEEDVDLDIDLDLDEGDEDELESALEQSFEASTSTVEGAIPEPEPAAPSSEQPLTPSMQDLFDDSSFEPLEEPEGGEVDSLFAEAEAELNTELGFAGDEAPEDADVIVPSAPVHVPRKPTPTVGEEYDFSSLADDDEIEELDDIEEIDENAILEALEDDDDDLADAFGELLLPDEDQEPAKSKRGLPPPPPNVGKNKP
jgi:SAM-dependent methyltransferase